MLKPIDPKKLNANVFSMLDDSWALITAGNRENCNTMTASWGGLGILWNKPVATIYLRPQRYTKTFVDREDYFTVAFFGADYHGALELCGAKSGREVDKVNKCGFSIAYGEGDAPYFQEAELVFICKKLYRDSIKPQCFLDSAPEDCYPKKDYHDLYIGEIVAALQNS
ncbi:MAG: flavin reductase family protein [Oscillospiraceae bacterium]